MENFKADFFNTSMIAGVVGSWPVDCIFWDQRAFYFFTEFFFQILQFGWFGVVTAVRPC